MKYLIWIKQTHRKPKSVLFVLLLSLLAVSCASVDPKNVDVVLPETAPVVKTTSFTESLADLGLMTEIYDTDQMKIQSHPISDRTGTAQPTGGEIPQDITEMVKSSLNSIGGKVVYIPYDPSFIQNQMVTGYSSFNDKVIPDMVLSGGITEFDRGLQVRGSNTDVAAEFETPGLPGMSKILPGKEVGGKYGSTEKAGLARITLDFNLLDFRTMTGIPRMNAVNTMEVNKAMAEKELAIALFGITFGRKGTIKKVQGRHDAVRLLVELSMIQIVGKYNALPYWRLLGDDAIPDKTVTQAISRYYNTLTEQEIVEIVQEWLFLHGYDVPTNGVLDNPTKAALQQFNSSYDPKSDKIDPATFTNLYLTIPINDSALKRRNMLAERLASAESSQSNQESRAQESVAVGAQEQAAPTPPAQQSSSAEVQASSAQTSKDVQSKETSIPPRKGSIGRIITDKEW